MLNAQSQVHYKAFAFILSPHLLSRTSAHPCYNQCCSERGSCFEVLWGCCWVLGVRNPQSTACDVWSLRFQDKAYISDNLSFSYVILFMYSLICHYMHETWSWHAYRFALGFLWKNRCDIGLGLGVGCEGYNWLHESWRSGRWLRKNSSRRYIGFPVYICRVRWVE
jgi:hypothetical protein